MIVNILGLFDAIPLDLQGWISAVSAAAMAVFSGFLLLSTNATNRLAKSAHKASLRPVLIVEVEPVEPSEDIFRRTELYFTIRNVGNGPAFVERLYRLWDVRIRGLPEPISVSKPPSRGRMRDNMMAIGAGQKSSDVLMLLNDLKTEFPERQDGERIIFYGFIICSDLDGEKYISGFCQTYRKDLGLGGFNVPWDKGIKHLNYHRHFRTPME